MGGLGSGFLTGRLSICARNRKGRGKFVNIALVTLFPEMLAAITQYGITGRAVKRQQVRIQSFNPRDYTEDRHRTVDDRPYGGGPGMVMMAEPLQRAVAQARSWVALQPDALPAARVIYLSPQGRRLDQAGVVYLQGLRDLILVAGRYEGVDERFIQAEVDEEWSIGDYVLSGGELPAMVLIDAIARLEPGVLGDSESAVQDSFSDGLLDYPHYTRPEVYQGVPVPNVLLSGHHEEITRWRHRQALQRTAERRPDLLEKAQAARQAFESTPPASNRSD